MYLNDNCIYFHRINSKIDIKKFIIIIKIKIDYTLNSNCLMRTELALNS